MSRHAVLPPTTEGDTRWSGRPEAGVALVIVLLLTMLLLVLGSGVALVVDSEIGIAANHRSGVEVSYAAEGAVDFAIQELAQTADWTLALSGSVTSRLAGPAVLPPAAGRAQLDLLDLTTRLQRAEYAGNIWGADTPRWRLFGHGVPGMDVSALTGLPASIYAIVWLSDDIAESDGDPWTDANGVVVVRARAIGPRRAQAEAQAVIARVGPGVVRRISTRAVR